MATTTFNVNLPSDWSPENQVLYLEGAHQAIGNMLSIARSMLRTANPQGMAPTPSSRRPARNRNRKTGGSTASKT
jgi:hypothetical protein